MPMGHSETAARPETLLTVTDYDLNATLSSGQAFGWRFRDMGWESVIGDRWVRLRAQPQGIHAVTPELQTDWDWLRRYLQCDVILEEILRTFPADAPMESSIAACRGLRLLRQDPWECLASFILSSTKQIVQIQQIHQLLRERYGKEVIVPHGRAPAYSFPSAERLASATEAELRDCKMGFRAPNLLGAARAVAEGRLRLEPLGEMAVEAAREQLCLLRGVGPKIANCVLLFAYGFPTAFPVDVWVLKAIQNLYFPRRRASRRRLETFVSTHFGPHSGYAQQYLFHYMRTSARRG